MASRRNRETTRGAARGLGLRYKVLAVFAAAVAVVTIAYLARAQYKTEQRNALYHITELKRDIGEAKNVNAQLKFTLAQLERPDHVLQKLKEHGVVLSVAPPDRVVRVTLPTGIEGLPDEPVAAPAPDGPGTKQPASLLASAGEGSHD